MSPEDFVSRLIDAEDFLGRMSFEDLLATVRMGFEHLSDGQLDALFAGARKRASS
jgi:hypothetical protein